MDQNEVIRLKHKRIQKTGFNIIIIKPNTFGCQKDHKSMTGHACNILYIDYL